MADCLNISNLRLGLFVGVSLHLLSVLSTQSGIRCGSSKSGSISGMVEAAVVADLFRDVELAVVCLVSSLVVIVAVLVTVATSPSVEEPLPKRDTVDGPSCPSNEYRHNRPYLDPGIRCS